MGDPRVVVVDSAQLVAAAERQVAGIEQQRDAGAGIARQLIELGLGLHHRRHVVMIGERHALVGAPFAGSGIFGVGPHLVVGELRLALNG